MTLDVLKEYLDEKVEQFNHSKFIEDDPILIPHLFTDRNDIEIIGFLVATIAWGKRQMIIKNSYQLLDIMGHEPYRFVMESSEKDLKDLNFVHRTFNTIDLQFFIKSLNRIYTKQQTLEDLFVKPKGNMQLKIAGFRTEFLKAPHDKRSEKHLSNPLKNSSAKRLNMYLRWMVRKDQKGVDFGIWNGLKPSELYMPLDVHTGNVGRKLGFIKRKANDWKALEELMVPLREMDQNDPVKYDFALFGLGVTGEL
jgi:uncharacterized protein (TIGR02757 family)